MKKLLIFVLICFAILGTTGCGCSRVEDKNSDFYNKELSFDFDRMDTISADIREAIEEGIKDAVPVKMEDGHFNINRNNYSYSSEEGTTKTKASFYEFVIDARADEKSAIVTFKGIITIDFESTIDGSTYTIKNKNHKEIEFDISNLGNCLYDEKTGNFTIVIPEFKETGTITQTGQKTTTTKSGDIDEEKPKTNTWNIDETWDNVKISFVAHSDSK